jgi:HD-like signal output (HDOD) protein
MLKSLLQKFTKKQAEVDETLPLGVRSAIDNFVRGSGIPSMNASAGRAFAVATNPSSEPRDFVEVLESDDALASRVMRIANSVYFSRGVQIKRLEDAVVTIGLNELRGLLNASTVGQLFPLKHHLREVFWRNSIVTATLAKHFSPRFQVHEPDFAFLAGLIHDLGKLFLLKHSTEIYQKVSDTVVREGVPFATVELTHFPFTHCEIGHYIAQRWNFSPDLIRCIRFHHEHPAKLAGLGSNFAVTFLVQFADAVAHAIASGFPEQHTPFTKWGEEAAGLCLVHSDLSATQLPALLEEARRVLIREQDGILSWANES